ncbi:hypothetical protein [Pseudoclavibacter helvolus]|uniref:hypothetical protein n=1 Tax=Pseudoclavibacter helvolus TaxID=255205 RepID=UPI003C781669
MSYTAEIIQETRDEIFSRRSTAAAVRWAVGHEMAHAIGRKQERAEAFKRAERLLPDLVDTQWGPKWQRGEIKDFRASTDRYKDEIACDLLASQYVLESPFATDDLITQICGSLLALEALVFDGFRSDESAVSQTHPSPSLRFQIIFMDWMETILDQSTWQDREHPGYLGLQDVAHMLTFERWAAGHYRPHRAGNRWQEDMNLAMDLMLGKVPLANLEQIYVRQGGSLARLPQRTRLAQ